MLTSGNRYGYTRFGEDFLSLRWSGVDGYMHRLRDAGVPEDICNDLGGWSAQGEGKRYDKSLQSYREAIHADAEA